MKTKLDTALRVVAVLLGAMSALSVDPTIACLVIAVVEIAIVVNAARKDGPPDE